MNREAALQTREQRHKARKWDRMFVSRAVITSKAFLSLKTSAACQIYLLFLGKCRMEQVQVDTKPGRRQRKEYVVANNGEIVFPYSEAEEKYGISRSRFRAAIDELLRVGLIDIAHSGYGLYKDATKYSISDRWQNFGTPEFVQAERPKNSELGFKKGNQHGRNCQTAETEQEQETAGEDTTLRVAYT